ncbi:MAG: DUF2975 domain-containing protein [Lachnospiraceae bacterium]|nr:DUF2975 domain-containing protein [Lachnospiraceae bacterium]
MLKIPSKLSILLSIAVSVAFFVLCGSLAVYMPIFVELMVEAANNLGVSEISQQGETVVLVLAYLILLTVVAADALLFTLLMRVRSGNVFTAKSIGLIRGVSWCCFLLAGIFCGLGFYFTMVALLLAFVAVFLGLCLRVVKNVIEEATEIKSESDLTV